VPEATLVDLYRGADLFVFPSLAEGFGLPVAEALACGTPSIASDRTSLPELLPADALFDPGDAGAIAKAIERALTDKGHRDRLAAWAARPPRTWTDVARETLAAYDGVTA
jgi:glycosyltransferase involved in cell wall biosynthesis